uniref:Uncharacterized protein n=1 Tax=Oryza brachyantha TaxID=4533 RepID=J3MPC3_ORYBR
MLRAIVNLKKFFGKNMAASSNKKERKKREKESAKRREESPCPKCGELLNVAERTLTHTDKKCLNLQRQSAKKEREKARNKNQKQTAASKRK